MCGAVQKRRTFGDVAQLGERLNRTQEVRGSIPLVSTKSIIPVPYRPKALARLGRSQRTRRTNAALMHSSR